MNKQELIEKLKELEEKFTLKNQSYLCLDRTTIVSRNAAYNKAVELAQQLDEPSERVECEFVFRANDSTNCFCNSCGFRDKVLNHNKKNKPKFCQDCGAKIKRSEK